MSFKWEKEKYASFRSVVPSVTIKCNGSDRSLQITEEDIIQYDGYTIIHRSEKYESMRKLRSSIEKGWIVKCEDSV